MRWRTSCSGAVPEDFETLVFRLERLIGGIDSVVVTGRYWTRGEGAWADVSFVHLWELRGGKVTGFGIFKDHPDLGYRRRVRATRA